MTLNDKLEAFLRSHANQWLHSESLASIAGRCGWRTRVSDLRLRRGLNIENRVRRVKRADGTSFAISEYRYLPASRAEITAAVQAAIRQNLGAA